MKNQIMNIEKLLELEPGTLTGAELLADLEAWDSLAVIGFMAMVDELHQKNISPSEISQATTVADLIRLMC